MLLAKNEYVLDINVHGLPIAMRQYSCLGLGPAMMGIVPVASIDTLQTGVGKVTIHGRPMDGDATHRRALPLPVPAEDMPHLLCPSMDHRWMVTLPNPSVRVSA